MYNLVNEISGDAVSSVENSREQDFPGCRYYLIPENRFHIDLGKYYTYGIQAVGADFSNILHDVSTCKETAVRMMELFNRHQLSPVHLRDVVEDLI